MNPSRPSVASGAKRRAAAGRGNRPPPAGRWSCGPLAIDGWMFTPRMVTSAGRRKKSPRRSRRCRGRRACSRRRRRSRPRSMCSTPRPISSSQVKQRRTGPCGDFRMLHQPCGRFHDHGQAGLVVGPQQRRAVGGDQRLADAARPTPDSRPRGSPARVGRQHDIAAAVLADHLRLHALAGRLRRGVQCGAQGDRRRPARRPSPARVARTMPSSSCRASSMPMAFSSGPAAGPADLARRAGIGLGISGPWCRSSRSGESVAAGGGCSWRVRYARVKDAGKAGRLR